MGFGILIFGYAFLFNVPFHGIDVPPDVIGYVIMLYALHLLSGYAKSLRAAYYLTTPLILTSGGRLALQAITAIGREMPNNAMLAIQIAEIALLFLFYAALLLGIARLAHEVDVPKIEWTAKRNLAFIIIFYIFTVITNLYGRGILPHAAGIEPFALAALQQLFGYLLRILILILFYSCYMRICLEGEEDMPYTPSRFEQMLIDRRNGGNK